MFIFPQLMIIVKSADNEEVKSPVNEEVKSPVNEEVKSPVNEEVKSPVNEEVKSPVNEEVKSADNEKVRGKNKLNLIIINISIVIESIWAALQVSANLIRFIIVNIHLVPILDIMETSMV